MDSTNLDELIVNSDTSDTTLVVSESTELVSLRVQDEEETLAVINDLQNILLDDTASVDDKSDAYDELLSISNNKTIESNLEKIISKEFKLECFIKVKGTNITVFVDNNEHDYKLANDIIRRISKEIDSNKYITVKFS
jgi:stage III sporulation protein AH